MGNCFSVKKREATEPYQQCHFPKTTARNVRSRLHYLRATVAAPKTLSDNTKHRLGSFHCADCATSDFDHVLKYKIDTARGGLWVAV